MHKDILRNAVSLDRTDDFGRLSFSVAWIYAVVLSGLPAKADLQTEVISDFCTTSETFFVNEKITDVLIYRLATTKNKCIIISVNESDTTVEMTNDEKID